MAIIETEIWKPNPDRPGTLVFDSQRPALDIFNELEAHLKADGRLPDEYFLFDAHGNWRDGKLFPKDAEILCNANYGGNEGVYLDISVRYQKDVYEYNAESKGLGWHKRAVTEHFATGKTLGQTVDDLDRMNLAAASVMAAFYGMEREVKERYAKIERGEAKRQYPRDEPQSGVHPDFAEHPEADYSLEEGISAELAAKLEPSARVINGEVNYGDWVIVRPDERYGCLVGQITGIDKLSSEEHDTDNPGDDIHVNFVSLEYSEKTKAELLESLDGLYPDAADLDDIPLDDVIMAPEHLISLTGLDFDHIGELSADYKAALEFGNSVLAENFNGLEQQLIRRVEQNYADYNQSLLPLSKRDLIEKAAEIHAVSDAHSYMTVYHAYSDEELQFYMKFANPLEIVADAWREQKIDLEDMSAVMDFVYEQRGTHLSFYPQINGAPPEPAEKAEPLTLKERLNEKLSSEYGAFISGLKTKSPASVIESSYEKVFKEDLKLTVEDGDFSDVEMTAMLSQDNLLGVLYHDWLDTDASYMDILRDCVDGSVGILVKETLAEEAENEHPAIEEPKTAAQEKSAAPKEKSAFDMALSRGKEKSEAYKAQKAREPAADRKPREERS